MKRIGMALLLLTTTGIGSVRSQSNTPVSSSTKTVPHMKAFVVLVSVPLSYTAEMAKSVNPQWEKTIAGWKASGHYITSYAFPGANSVVIAGGATPVSRQMVASEGNRQVSHVLLRAATLEAAVELAKACPVLAHGGSVEVREVPAGEPIIYQ